MSAESIQATLNRYVEALESTDFEAAGACFTEDAFYSHPPFDGEDHRHEARGRAGVVALLKAGRGERNWVHKTETFLVKDNRLFMEGELLNGDDGSHIGSYIASGTFNEDSLISRWVAYGSTPPVGATLES